MARNRSMRRMRNRSRNRSKRGGVLRMFQSGDMKKFKELLREIPSISSVMDNADTANQYKLTEYEKTEIVKKLGEYFNGLSDEERSNLSEQLTNAEKKKLYEQVYAVLNTNRLKDTLEAYTVVPDVQVAHPSYTSSTSPSTLPADPSAKVLRKDTTTGPGGFKTNPQRAGKSRRRRRARRTIKKSRNVRRTRRNKLRTKRGGGYGRMFQSSLLREYKSKLESSSLNDLLQQFKNKHETNLDQATIDEINTDYDTTSNGELNFFLRRLTNEQVKELLKDIKYQTTEGKAFYRYILLKILADNGRAEAQNILAGMFTMSQGVPRNDTEASSLYALAGARGDADVQAEWSKYTSDFDL